MVRSVFVSLLAIALFGGAAKAQYPYYVPYSTYQSLAPLGPFPFNYGIFASSGGMGPFYPYTANYNGAFGMYAGFVPSFFGMSSANLFAPNPTPLPDDQDFTAPKYLVAVSGSFSASLTIDFPAAAKVWVDGKELPGKPATERVIHSPAIEAGQQHTFHIKARWQAKGKTYEYTREAKVGPGDRSKIQVVNGTEVKK